MTGHEWERVLWKSQPYPDNYVPDSFLSTLSMNVNFKPHNYWLLMLGSYTVTQHLSTLLIFLVIFVRLMNATFDPRLLMLTCAILFVTGCAIWELLHFTWRGAAHNTHDRRAKTLKGSILVFLALMALSPILRTVTAGISSDSVWALSAWLFVLNTAFADYRAVGFWGRPRERWTSVVSINAAICAAVVLASRLCDDISVFAFVLFSVELFGLFPVLRHRLQVTHVLIHTALTALLAVVSILLTASLSIVVTYMYLAVLVCINFVAPALLIWAQRFKNEIRGPWDAATPMVNI
ncbi:phosphatidylinositol N-acetylglucosaminyltransferase [Dentipellis sp. KUC8613]|nr:phosphatidylinositol N-acetylglucosaminyltransferase [Dentipellis sp. KUC8613]